MATDSNCALITRLNLPDIPVCALLMPFGALYEDMYLEINQAITNVGLQCRRADKIEENDIWIKNIFNLIATAKVVVAILVCMDDSPHPNANVMYELGLSHAFGKATLIIECPKKTIPSNLLSFNVFSVERAEIEATNFRVRIENRLNNLLNGLGSGFIQRRFDGINMLYGPVTCLTESHFTEQLRKLMEFNHLVRDQIQHLVMHVKLLSYMARRLQNSITVDQVNEFGDQLTQYVETFVRTTEPVLFKKLANLAEGAKSAMAVLGSYSVVTIDNNHALGVEAFDNILLQLQGFRDENDKIFAIIYDIPGQAKEIARHINLITQKANSIVNQTSVLSTYIINIIQAMSK